MMTISTLGDVLRQGDAAAGLGRPVTPRWAQVRVALLLLQHACGDLDQVRTCDFAVTFPDCFGDLDPVLARRFPTAYSYKAVRREIRGLLARMGVGLDEGWDSLRRLARIHRGERTFRDLVALSTPAGAAGILPRGVTRAWALGQDAMLQRSSRRAYRRGLRAFDTLFDVPEIAAEGLLPPSRVGPLPVYDKRGRVLEPLPPKLAVLCAAARSEAERRDLRCLWRAIHRAGGLGLPADPSADELLAPAVLDGIAALQSDGVGERVFSLYRSGGVRVLRRHATHPHEPRVFRRPSTSAVVLPARLSMICAQAIGQGERTGLRGVWKAVRRAGGLGLPADPSAEDLLTPATWTRIAALPVEAHGVAPRTFAQYRRAAARLLRRNATPVDRSAVEPLPPRLEGILATERRKGERVGLRAIWRAARRLELGLPADPTADDLRAPTIRMQIAALPAADISLAPATWKVYRRSAARALRRHAAAPPRPAKAKAPQPDRRRRGHMALPLRLAAELDPLLDLMGYAANSRRALRSVLVRQFTAACRAGTATTASSLSEVLDAADRRLDATGARPEDRACLTALRAARHLAEVPAWRALQDAVSRAGIAPAGNPVPTLFAAAGETIAAPCDLTRDWAWQHERGLRPDLRITFSANIDRLDALRANPVLVDCGLLPAERLGPMPPRRGRHRHAVYPLPRTVEAAIAALDASDAERFSIEGSVHFVWHLARDAGLYQPGDAPAADDLLSTGTVDRLRKATRGRGEQAAWREHIPRLRRLVPVETTMTPQLRWERLFVAARGFGLPAAALVPLYGLKTAALAAGLGPERLTRAWALSQVAAAPRPKANALNRGLRILDALRGALAADLLPPATVGDGRPVRLA